MGPQEFEVSVSTVGAVGLVRLRGELDLANSRELDEQLAAVDLGTTVVDLVELGFVDSSGLAALVAARERSRERGRELVLTRPQENVRRVLEMTGLADWISPWRTEWDPAGL